MLGSRVTLQSSYEGQDLNNLTGTIIEVGEFNYLIAIDNWFNGHGGHGCKNPRYKKLRTKNNCWWVKSNNFLSMSPPAPDEDLKKQAVIDKIKYLETKFQNRKSNHVNG